MVEMRVFQEALKVELLQAKKKPRALVQ